MTTTFSKLTLATVVLVSSASFAQSTQPSTQPSPQPSDAKGAQLECRTNMTQVDAGDSVGIAGDTNQWLEFALTPNANGELEGSQSLRYEFDQSAGRGRLSRHGLTARAVYSAGNGLDIVFGVREFKDESANAKSKAVGGFILQTGYENPNSIKDVSAGYISPKLLEVKDNNFRAAIEGGKVKTGDLISVGVSGCEFTLE